MRTIGDLSLIRERVSPFASITAAILKMQELGAKVLAVVEDEVFRGIVTRDQALMAAPDATVKEVLQTLVIEMPVTTPVRTAARLFVENSLDYVPVVKEGAFVGLLTANQLLIELGRSWDPMTGLTWSDRLRDWGVEALESGREVTLSFIDLNGFGDYNKAHGHIVGDRVLRAVAQQLSEVIKPDSDVLVRYGGDEFVIGTLRPRKDLEVELARVTSLPVTVEGVPDPVTYAVGYSGGKRTRERERVHFASTLDNLINLASQDCLSKKPNRPVPLFAPIARAHTRHVQVEVEVTGSTVRAVASINIDGQTALSSAQSEDDALGAAANAVCSALGKLRPESQVMMEDVVVYRRWDGQPVALVAAVIRQRHTEAKIKCSGSSQDGVYASVAEALVTAMLRVEESSHPSAGVSDD